MFDIYSLDEDGKVLYNLTQWDSGQRIKVDISGLDNIDIDKPPMVNISNKESNKVYSVKSAIKNNILTADIPNVLLTQASPIIAYICNSDTNIAADNTLGSRSTKANYRITIPVAARIQPEDYIYGESDNLFFEELKDELKEHTLYAELDHPDLSVTTNKLKDKCVTAIKIADNAVTENKLDKELQNKINNMESGLAESIPEDELNEIYKQYGWI